MFDGNCPDCSYPFPENIGDCATGACFRRGGSNAGRVIKAGDLQQTDHYDHGAAYSEAAESTTILDEAKQTVYERNTAYGQVEDNFARIAQMWSAYLDREVTPQDVGMMMVLLKVARQRHQFKRDNLVDIAGYAECVGRMRR